MVQGSEWGHGDFGTCKESDVVVAFSHSGRTSELVDVGVRAKGLGAKLIAVTGNPSSPLATLAHAHLHAAAATELLGKSS